eukprot:TRINITY_DN6424_c0_g2_i1.p1 TRINITY_DN6424_c0_g2~~TRINITY_DN6424_c0_g2_i1.p1  ORF type:complete len:427 (-),score=102.66 TRINITY_DN6424_c0_g2_i1:872-2152(-)
MKTEKILTIAVSVVIGFILCLLVTSGPSNGSVVVENQTAFRYDHHHDKVLSTSSAKGSSGSNIDISSSGGQNSDTSSLTSGSATGSVAKVEKPNDSSSKSDVSSASSKTGESSTKSSSGSVKNSSSNSSSSSTKPIKTPDEPIKEKATIINKMRVSYTKDEIDAMIIKPTGTKRITLEEWNSAGSDIPKTKPPKNFDWTECLVFDDAFIKKDVSRRVMQYIHVNVVAVFEQFNIPYMTYAGTTLGSVRKQRYIPWTADIDTLIPFQIGYVIDESTEVQNALYERGIVYFRDSKKSTDGVARMCIHKNTNIFPGGGSFPPPKDPKKIEWSNMIYYITKFPYMDVYSAKEKRSGQFMVHQYRSGKSCSACYTFDTKKLFPLGECDINGNMFTCPNDAPYVLQKMYGSRWKTPTCKNWNDTTKKCAALK